MTCPIQVKSNKISKRGLFVDNSALEPLEQLDCSKDGQTFEAQSPQDEDDSMYFEALDGTGVSTLFVMPHNHHEYPPSAEDAVTA